MRYKQVAAWVLFLAAPISVVHAQSDLGTINITASRAKAPTIASSRPVIIIDRKAIQASHAENVVDLLQGKANIIVRDTTGVGARSQVDIGGFGESAPANSVVLIDGRRINSPDLSGVDWTQIPVDQIERIEIVHGGGSVLYGDGAVGGVINIITRVPETGGEISLEGGSFGTYAGHSRIGADSGNIRVEANFSGSKTDGYRDNSTFERADGGARAELDLSNGLSLRLQGNHHRDRAGLPGSLSEAKLNANRRQTTSPRDFSRTTDSYVDGGLNWFSDAGLELDLAGGVRRRTSHSEFVNFGSTSDIVLRTRSLRPRLTFSRTDTIRFRLTAGADIDRTDGSIGSTKSSITKRKRDGYYGLLELGGMGNRWDLSGGWRSERVETTFQTPAQVLTNRDNAWEAGASVGLIEGLRLRLNVASSIRNPLLDEYFNTFSGAVTTTLTAQTGRHYGVGLEYNLGDAGLEVSASRADLDNEIFYNPTTFANENYTNKTRHDVLVVSVHWNAHEWVKLSANYTYSKAHFRGGSFDGKTIPAVPRHRAGGNWQADWTEGLSTIVYVTYVGNSFQISDQANTRQKLPSYFVMDISAEYRMKDLKGYVRVANLLNRKYSTYGVSNFFYPAPEINVRGGVSYSF